MLKKFTMMVAVAMTLTACDVPTAPVNQFEDVAASFSKTSWNGVKLDAGSVWLDDSRTYLGVDFSLTGLGNNRSADVLATATNLQIDITCVKTYRNGRADRTRTRTYRNWNGSGSFQIDRNGRLDGTIFLDRDNSDKRAFCSGQGSGWTYEESVLVNTGVVRVFLGDRSWTIN